MLEELTLRIPAMKSQRNTPSAPNPFTLIAVAGQLVVGASAAGEGRFCRLGACH